MLCCFLPSDVADIERISCGLVAHIAQYNTVNVVSIGEDATRIICRVEYDIRTDRCVGFVLPLKKGLPEVDSF